MTSLKIRAEPRGPVLHQMDRSLMQRFEEQDHEDRARPLALALEDLPTEHSEEFPVEEAPETPFTDDPVRVYLREMGTYSLLTRDREIDLARRMERGRLRMHKAMSRSGPVREHALSLYRDIKSGVVQLDDVTEIAGANER